MTLPDAEVTARFPLFLIHHAQRNGLDVTKLLAKHGLSALEAEVQTKRAVTVRQSQLGPLCDDIAALLNDRHLGLSAAANAPMGRYGVVEFVVRAAVTLRGACENFVRFNALFAPSQVFEFKETADEGLLLHQFDAQIGIGFPAQNEFSAAMMARSFFTLLPNQPLRRVWFKHAPTGPAEDFEATFGKVEVLFNQPTNGFSFARELLDRPAATGDSALFAFLEEQASALLPSRPKTDELVEKVRAGIREAIKLGEPNIERLATRLNMSGRTLQRRLTDASTSFQQLLDDERFELARAYLKNDRLDVSEVAYLLGYSELRAFDRAFRRWASMAPSQWRDTPATN